jgi:hypothetical protein
MARVWKHHRAEQSFVGGLKKGACGEWVASHIRVTAAPSFCERRLRSIGEQKANCQGELFTSKKRVSFSTWMWSNFGKESIAES